MRKCTCLLLVILFTACVKPYNPPALAFPGGYLVVQGVINAGSDSTIITLSKTVSVSSAAGATPVPGAAVSVVSDQGVVYPLTPSGNGNYFSPGLNLDVTRQYRLNITANNKQYQSDPVPVGITPPIDSVGFNVVNAPEPGVQIYANTHDATNTVKYYRWDYTETWEFRAQYFSYYVGNGTALVIRSPAQQIDLCFGNEVSSDIVLGSTAKLQQDVLYQSPIAFISSTSEKLEAEYSILLRQYALTADAYNFWTSLKTNTESLGSIFDAEPSQLTGNIHCVTNPSEPVIGYVSVCTVTSKRIFIYSQQLPAWVPIYPYSCAEDSLGTVNGVTAVNSSTIVTGLPPVRGDVPDPVLYSDRQCADCTIRGTTTRPPFWQ